MTVNYLSGYSSSHDALPTYFVTQKAAAQNMTACERVRPRHTTDYNLAYSGIFHAKLSLYVNNLFNQHSPVTWRDGWSPQLRTIGFSAAHAWFFSSWRPGWRSLRCKVQAASCTAESGLACYRRAEICIKKFPVKI